MKLRGLFGYRHTPELRDALLAHADALVRGDADRDVLLAQYEALVADRAEPLMALAERTQRTMTMVNPSQRFVRQLGRELALAAGDDPQSLWGRIRDMPPGMQLAAGIGGATLTAGLVFIASRSAPDALTFWRNRRAVTP